MNSIPTLSPAPRVALERFSMNPGLKQDWAQGAGLLAIGKHLMGDRFWSIWGDQGTNTAQALGRMIFAQCASRRDFNQLSVNCTDGTKMINDTSFAVTFVALATPNHTYYADPEAVVDFLVQNTNRDLVAIGSHLTLPLE